jgi:hypothetical protein
MFVLAIGFDLAGGFLIARGLLLTPSQLKHFGTWGGIGAASVVDRVRNRVDAQFGLALLFLGFLIQLIAYLLELAGRDYSSGSSRLPTGLALATLALALSLGTWALLRDRLLNRLLVRVALAPLGEDRPAGWNADNLASLLDYAKADHRARAAGESDRAYLARVFEVELPPGLQTDKD